MSAYHGAQFAHVGDTYQYFVAKVAADYVCFLPSNRHFPLQDKQKIITAHRKETKKIKVRGGGGKLEYACNVEQGL